MLLLKLMLYDKAIWGGYSWTNLTGNIGDFDTRFLLDVTNWKKMFMMKYKL
jgi:hypothetical protein